MSLLPDAASESRSKSVWIGVAVVAAYTSIAVLFALQRYAGDSALGRDAVWRDAILQALIVWWSWAILTPMIIGIAHRIPISSTRIWPIAAHVPAGIAVTILHALLVAAITPQFYYQPAIAPIRDMFRGRLASALAFDTIIYFLIVAVVYIIGYVRDSRRREIEAAHMESALTRSQLNALQSQLQPHFLFNTLNSIVALVHDEPDKATLMIRRLSELLRYCLATAERSEVALNEEVEFARAYLEIQKIRFEDRLEYSLEVDGTTAEGLVPSFVLQPLVENAVKFSLNDDARTTRIRVASVRDNGKLIISVIDNGPGTAESEIEDSAGIGIRTTRARIRQMYGKDHDLTISAAPDGGAIVSVALPYRTGLPGTSA